jgi:hypothetical protein
MQLYFDFYYDYNILDAKAKIWWHIARQEREEFDRLLLDALIEIAQKEIDKQLT